MSAGLSLIDDQSYLHALRFTGFTLLLRMRDDLDRARTSPGTVIRYAHVFARLAKVENDRQRLDVNLEIARIKAQAAVDAANARHAPDDDRDEYTPDAPWGRKKDGTPYTHEEFMVFLRRACRDIWGLDLPKNYGQHPSHADPTDDDSAPDDGDDDESGENDDDEADDDPAPDDDDDDDESGHEPAVVVQASLPADPSPDASAADKLSTQHPALITPPPTKPVQTFSRHPESWFHYKKTSPLGDL